MKHQRPRQIFKPHPIFGWTLTPNAQIYVPFRKDVVQNIDSNGLRQIPTTRENTKANLVIYGCSFTYGTGLTDDETYAAILQKSLPNIKVINKGTGGHNTVQNFLRFRNDINANRVSIAIFGVISDHRYRNIAHPYRMKAFLSPDWQHIGVEHVPHIHFDRQGDTLIEFTPIYQPSLTRNDFDIFLPDEYYLDLTTIAVFCEILSLARKNKIPVVFALLDQLDSHFNQLMLAKFNETFDISTPYNKEYSFQPKDIHPNPHANHLFAERLLPVIQSVI